MPSLVQAVIVGVYRRRNVPHVVRLLEPARELGWRTAWWGLDGIDPVLRDVTVGQGPGEKFPLVNRALQSLPGPAQWTVVSDDDVRFVRGDIVEFLRYCARAGLDLAQPARARRTETSHEITVEDRLARVRLTTFVETGPMFAVGSRWRERLLPLPEERGMGWGVELDWLDLMRSGCRLGIVDATIVEHLGAAGVEYDKAELQSLLDAELAARGVDGLEQLAVTLASWPRWRRSPPWLRRSR